MQKTFIKCVFRMRVNIFLHGRKNLIKRFKNGNNTVGKWVVKSPRSDSSKSCFWIFGSIVNTPTKKNPYHEIPCYLPVFRYLPSKSKLRRKSCNFFGCGGVNFELQYLGFCSDFVTTYLYSFERFFGQLFSGVYYKYCQFSSFLVRGQNVKKTVKKSQKSNISGLAKKSCTELQAENMLNVIFQGPSFQ